jgi:biopolymer transport protein ExbD/biopolymer transport protein TolR
MGMSVGRAKRGIVSEMNVVPLIDILLVLLVIFMIIPHHWTGEDALLPQQSEGPVTPQPEVVVVQVLGDGSLRINQEKVEWEGLTGRLEGIFKLRADHTAFIRGDSLVEFGVVAKVLDAMHTAGISSVGLMTPGLDKGN